MSEDKADIIEIRKVLEGVQDKISELEKKLNIIMDEWSNSWFNEREKDDILERLEKLEELHKSMLGDVWSDEHT